MLRLLTLTVLSVGLCLATACYTKEEDVDVAATPTTARLPTTDTSALNSTRTPLPPEATSTSESVDAGAVAESARTSDIGRVSNPGHLTVPDPKSATHVPTLRPCPEDSFEDNDSPETGRQVTLPFLAAGLRVCGCDEDFFSFPLTDGETLRVEVSFYDPEGEFGIGLLDPQGMAVAGTGFLTDNETITYTCCGPAGAGTYTVDVYLSRGPRSEDAIVYALDISSVLPTPCAPGGCPTPTVTPTPLASLDFSLGIDTDGDTTDDCGTRAWETTECVASPADTMTLKVYLNGLPQDAPTYRGFDILLEYVGVHAEGSPDTLVWPECVFPASFSEPGLLAFGCAAVYPSSHVGVIGTSALSCSSAPITGSVTMVHGPGATQLVQAVGVLHREGIQTTEGLSISCVQPTPSPAPVQTPSPTASPMPTPLASN